MKPHLQCCAGRNLPAPPPPSATERTRAIFDNQFKWVSGTQLTYSFLGGRATWQDAVRAAFDEWSRWAAITFREVGSDGQIRIAFDERDGAWSYLGRQAREIPLREPTMNIGWSPLTDPDVALHEIGHTLGLHHEHQHPDGITWDEQAVINELSGPPNWWDLATIESNVFSTVPRDRVTGSDIADVDSIMMYQIPASWIKSGPYAQTGINPTPGLSAGDKYWASLVYPQLTDPVEPGPPVDPDDPTDPTAVIAWHPIELDLNLMPSEQMKLRFGVPTEGQYAIGTTGRADTVCVLFEDGRQIAADDDSGHRRNAEILAVLRPDCSYEVVTRMNSRRESDVTLSVQRINVSTALSA